MQLQEVLRETEVAPVARLPDYAMGIVSRNNKLSIQVDLNQLLSVAEWGDRRTIAMSCYG